MGAIGTPRKPNLFESAVCCACSEPFERPVRANPRGTCSARCRADAWRNEHAVRGRRAEPRPWRCEACGARGVQTAGRPRRKCGECALPMRSQAEISSAVVVRRARVAALRSTGISRAAISAIVGESVQLVTRDLVAVGAPRPAAVVGVDGKSYPGVGGQELRADRAERRAAAVELRRRGAPVAEIALRLAVHPSTVSRWTATAGAST